MAGPIPHHFLIPLSVLIIVIFAFANAAIMVLVERKLCGHIQRRPGPFEVGPHGILQTAVDGLKLMGKQIIIPEGADGTLFRLAPILSFVPPIAALIVVPFSQRLQVRDLDIGVLFIMSLSAINVIALVIAGWASNNKYSLFGAIRAVAQAVAYEIPLLISLITIVLWVGSLRMGAIVEAQNGLWFVFTPMGFVAFLIYFITGIAETNRAPFDMPEAESELTAGFHTEYAGMGFGLFFLGEYTNMILVAAIATTLFLGGWHPLPFLTTMDTGFFATVITLLSFLVKAYGLLLVMIWIRWTFPRVRFDQLLNFCWKVLIPISLANLVVTALWLKSPFYG
ncbi:MAG: NADH-quinone oxidoreductase subunit NuoH [Deferrisomatales bacterium]|nr:NADH-quinone oxidoreductase subunit NuoH [Deferrisomatales bacterium]